MSQKHSDLHDILIQTKHFKKTSEQHEQQNREIIPNVFFTKTGNNVGVLSSSETNHS